MFGIIAALEALTRASRDRADAVVAFFAPALDWIQRWLPLFYVPSLIMLPLALRDIQGTHMTLLLGSCNQGIPSSGSGRCVVDFSNTFQNNKVVEHHLVMLSWCSAVICVHKQRTAITSVMLLPHAMADL